jgi:hypothetical protein
MMDARPAISCSLMARIWLLTEATRKACLWAKSAELPKAGFAAPPMRSRRRGHRCLERAVRAHPECQARAEQ